jgi:hypothetical protein
MNYNNLYDNSLDYRSVIAGFEAAGLRVLREMASSQANRRYSEWALS